MLTGSSAGASCLPDDSRDHASASAVTGSRTRAITNGTTADGDPAVVGLVAGNSIYCTGTLISPRVVITAGHCIDEVVPQRVFFGPAIDLGGTFVDVVERHAHPDLDRARLESDIGLVVLANAAPGEARPVPLRTRTLGAELVGQPLRIVGFGATEQAGDTDGRKRTGTTAFGSIDDTTFRFGPMPSQTCTGDSGGPAFFAAEDQEVLVGVTSSGDPACEVYGQDTRIDAYTEDFVCPLMDELGEQTASECPVAGGGGFCDAGGGAPREAAMILVAVAVVLARRRRPRVIR